MARTIKTSTASSKTESSVPVSAPVVAQVAAVATEEKVVKVKKAKAVKADAAPAPVAVAPVPKKRVLDHCCRCPATSWVAPICLPHHRQHKRHKSAARWQTTPANQPA